MTRYNYIEDTVEVFISIAYSNSSFSGDSSLTQSVTSHHLTSLFISYIIHLSILGNQYEVNITKLRTSEVKRFVGFQ